MNEDENENDNENEDENEDKDKDNYKKERTRRKEGERRIMQVCISLKLTLLSVIWHFLAVSHLIILKKHNNLFLL
ncbi:MAG: hypothetical protein IKQ47_07355 [Prevotella sp.]|nr:hypothetical protein [Prevotella sp.]